MSAAEPLLRVRDLAIRHEGEAAATPAGASFDVHRGEAVLLLGPSGSGKSTLTLALNGLIPHDIEAQVTGTVEVRGLAASSTAVSVLSRHVGMVFQDPDAQLVTGTVLDEVAFGPENLRMPVADVLARAEAGLQRVGLWQRRADNPDALSGGERQRLAIAAALALGSELVVLDEPTANLDPQGIAEVYAALRDVIAAGDRAIVLVEHNLDEAIGLVHRVVVLDAAGRTIADGPVEEVLRERAAELHDLGVWLPTATLAALRLRRAGFALDPLPLTPAALRAALERAPAPPALVERASSPPVERAQRVETPRPAPLITVRDLSVRRGRTEVLHGIDLDIHAGDVTAIVGANGAGKTTLLQAIAGVVRPPRGRVLLGADDVSRLTPRELARRIGFVFQNPEHQFVAHIVRDELAHGLPAGDREQRVADALARFGLESRADVNPFLLSGGQKRRLSVGAALIAGAPVLALDEPTFGQDRARADELLALLAQLGAEGTTVLVVTHDMQLVAEYADRTIVLGEGRVLADAPTAEVFADAPLLARARLRPPPLGVALQGLPRHPSLSGRAHLRDLPGAGA